MKKLILILLLPFALTAQTPDSLIIINGDTCFLWCGEKIKILAKQKANSNALPELLDQYELKVNRQREMIEVLNLNVQDRDSLHVKTRVQQIENNDLKKQNKWLKRLVIGLGIAFGIVIF
jgi:hypothetical protein